MKLHKKITVAAQPYPLVSEAANLNLFTPGRAVFTVQADQAVAGIVIFSAGYNPDQVKPWFIGYVETSTQVDNKQQRIFCRELTAVLFPRRPLALRDVNLKQILAAITQATTWRCRKNRATPRGSRSPANHHRRRRRGHRPNARAGRTLDRV